MFSSIKNTSHSKQRFQIHVTERRLPLSLFYQILQRDDMDLPCSNNFISISRINYKNLKGIIPFSIRKENCSEADRYS
ncbi:hypothetical protein DXB25_04135 [Lachnospiraceae bacterium OM02-31]|nr:hypothetical protein DXB25_04135 [Lachnospiraceae bacterium OM02-31]RJW57843.1 hypothetical protein DXB24_09430 [Lachnospiraceae bacterium OM02-3]